MRGRRSACVAASVAAVLAATPGAAAPAGGRALFQGFAPFAAGAGATDRHLPGGFAACANCHGSDGAGGREGGLVAPPIGHAALAGRGEGGGAYASDAAILAAIEDGVGRDGKTLSPLMPRYRLAGDEAAALLDYLHRVGTPADLPPGVSAGAIRLGTVLPLSGRLAGRGREALAGIEAVLAGVNAAGGLHGRRLDLVAVDPVHGQTGAADILVGAPVFAVIAGMWDPADPTLETRLAAARIPVVASLVVREAPAGADGVTDLLASRQAQRVALDRALAACPERPRWRVGDPGPVGGEAAERVFPTAAAFAAADPGATPAGCVAYAFGAAPALAGVIPPGWHQRIVLAFPAAVLAQAGDSLWQALGTAAARIAVEALATGGARLDEGTIGRALPRLHGFEPVADAPVQFSARDGVAWAADVVSVDPPARVAAGAAGMDGAGASEEGWR